MKTRFSFFGDLLIFFENKQNYSHQFHRIYSTKKCRKLIKRSPEIAILVKKYEIDKFGGSFDKFLAFYKDNFNEFAK